MPTYRLPNGSTTDDQTLYNKLWQELTHVVETLVPGAKAVPFDELLNHKLTFTVPGQEQLVLPVWFIQTLIKTARPVLGPKFKVAALRTQKCESCGIPVHTSGAGRTRRFCSECIIVRAKLRAAAKEDES